MFSFIKWFEANWQKIKSNKGLWFGFLTTISLIGIFVSLYFVNFLVNDVAKKTYENQKKHYLLESKVTMEYFKKGTLALSTAISKDTSLVLLFKSDDINKSKKLSKIAKNYTNILNSTLNSKDIDVKFTYLDKMVDKKIKNGLVVDDRGIAMLASVPMAESNNISIYTDVRKDISALKEYYDKKSKEFVLLLNRGAYSQVDSKIATKNYKNILDSYYADTATFSGEFIQDISKANLKRLLKDGYIKDLNYFFVAKKAYGYDGQEIGLIIIGEKINEENSFVNLIKNLVNSVTIVALGLIVSMILFLF
jgi:hypothetical protein